MKEWKMRRITKEDYKEGEHSTAVCENCKTIVTTTFKLRGVTNIYGGDEITIMLCAICDQCDALVAIPHSVQQ